MILDWRAVVFALKNLETLSVWDDKCYFTDLQESPRTYLTRERFKICAKGGWIEYSVTTSVRYIPPGQGERGGRCLEQKRKTQAKTRTRWLGTGLDMSSLPPQSSTVRVSILFQTHGGYASEDCRYGFWWQLGTHLPLIEFS
ncbi:hypothetical protein Tco_0357290 [Tanacetum coccineum]